MYGILNVAEFNAINLSGTLNTGVQPDITQIGTLSRFGCIW
jgi:hypothetical protein